MKFRHLALAAAALLSFGTVPAAAADSQGAANIQLIKNFLSDTRAAMASRDPAKARAVAERYMDADYVQHSPGFAPGREGYISSMTALLSGGMPPGGPPPGGPPPGGPPAGGPPPGGPPGGPPGAPMSPPKDLYFVADGQLVVWVSEGMQPGKLDFNMVRVVDGKMKEHWDSR